MHGCARFTYNKKEIRENKSNKPYHVFTREKFYKLLVIQNLFKEKMSAV